MRSDRRCCEPALFHVMTEQLDVRTRRCEHLEFTDVTTRVNDEMVRFHEAADLFRCLPSANVPASTIELVTSLIRNSTAAVAMMPTTEGIHGRIGSP